MQAHTRSDQLAKLVVDIATGDADDTPPNDGKDPAAVAPVHTAIFPRYIP